MLEILLFLWLSIIFLLFYIFRKKSIINIPTFPNSFDELSLKEKRKSLDLAWSYGKHEMITFSPSLAFAKFIKYALAITSIIFLLLNWQIIAVSLTERKKDECLNYEDEEFCEEQKLNSIYGFIFTGGTNIFLIYLYLINRRKVILLEQEAINDYAIKKRFKALGVDFVSQNFSEWLENMHNITKNLAIKEANVESKEIQSYMFYSSKYDSGLGMPPISLGVTYVFSNGFLSVVSNIRFLIKETSYSQALKDIDNSYGYVISKTDDWITDEFHYSDIVEVGYQPSDDVREKFNTRYNAVSNNENDYPVDGFLSLTLINSKAKKYPTSKDDTYDFINMVREKVRALKT